MSAEDHVVRASEMKPALAPNFYLSPEVYRLETERISHRHGFVAGRFACEFLFHESETAKPGFDPSDVVDFRDVVNRQDWRICEGVQAGMRSRGFRGAYYAPMEDPSLDIRRFLEAHLGDLTAIR